MLKSRGSRALALFFAVSKDGLACPPSREKAFRMTSQNASLREEEQVSLRSDGEDDDDDDDEENVDDDEDVEIAPAAR